MKVWVLTRYLGYEGEQTVSIHKTYASAIKAADALRLQREEIDIEEWSVQS